MANGITHYIPGRLIILFCNASLALDPSENLKAKIENDAVELAVIAQGLAKAAELLAGQFTLVTTNVPYIGRGKQDDVLKAYCERVHSEAKSDLATCFVDRCLEFCADRAGSTALVTPQNWLFLGSYKHLRHRLLKKVTWNTFIRLGPRAFEAIGGEVVNVALLIISRSVPEKAHVISGIDASAPPTPAEKAMSMTTASFFHVSQVGQLRNPDARLVLEEGGDIELLQKYASGVAGIQTGDFPQFGRYFWEVQKSADWEFEATTVDETNHYDGKCFVLYWQNFKGVLASRQKAGESYVRGWAAFGKRGLLVSSMGGLSVTL